MFIGNMHINIVKGDFKFKEWEEDGWKNFRKKVHDLRKQGYRKIDQEHGYLNYYEYYRQRGKKQIITLTMMCL